MTREEFYITDRGERKYYETTEDQEVFLPVTNDGFESLLELGAGNHNLPVDDKLRSILAGYIHHIPSDEMMIDVEKMSKVLYKNYANTMTFDIDQAAKKRVMEEVLKKNPDPNVLPIKKESDGVQG